VPTIVVDVMPKAELLDPQGKAVAGALARTGRTGFTGVRIGKRFELTVDGPVDDALKEQVQQIAEEAAHAAAEHGEAGYVAPAGETH